MHVGVLRVALKGDKYVSFRKWCLWVDVEIMPH